MPDTRLVNLQILRFVAAISIVFTHVSDPILGGRSAIFAFPWVSGVDVFFVISGFIMAVLSVDRYGRPGAGRGFLVRRAIRIVPSYWGFTLLAAAALAVVPSASSHTGFTWGGLFASLAFVPAARAGDGQILPILPQGWTLVYEAFFYVAWAASLSIRRGQAVLTIAFAALAALHLAFRPDDIVLAYYSDPIILEFVFGVGIAALYGRGWRLPWWGAAIGMASVPVLLIVGPDLWPRGVPRPLVFGLPAALLVGCAALAPQLRDDGGPVRLLARLGDASYVLYLSHIFVAALNLAVLARLGLPLGWPAIAAGVVLAVLASAALHGLIERPMLAALHRRLPRRSRDRPPQREW